MSTSIGTIATGAGNGAAVKPADPNQPQPVVKAKRKRSPSVAKPAYIIVQVLGEDGQPAQFDKKRMKIVAVERQADNVLEAIEEGQYPNAFYLRVIVPGGSRAGSPNKPKDA